MRRSALASPPPRWRRRARRITVSVVLLAGAGAGVVAFRDHTRTESAPTTTAVVLKTASVETGDLTTTEKIDGTISETDTITVLHRIEGQTSSATGASSNGSSSGGASSGGASPAASGPSAAPVAALINDASSFLPSADCPTPDSPTTSTSPSVPVDPAGLPPSDTTTTTSTTVVTTTSATVPADPGAATTAPAAPPTSTCAPTTTTATTTPVADTTPTAVAGGGAPTGGFGGAAPIGAVAGGGASSGATASSSTRITQLVTWVASPGTPIDSGDAIYSIEGAPVTAMYGSLPAWRSLSTSSDDGADVLQLESNLRALGFDPDAVMTIDDEFDSDTKAAVERWQSALGVEVTGEVALGSVVFLPTATAVTSTSVEIGDEVGDGSSIVSLEGTTQQVVIDVPAEDQPYVLPGTTVVVAGTPATVVSLRSADESGTIAVQAIISPSAHIDVADGSAVKVQLTIEQATGVLLVPADALLSRLDGSYAVQTSAADGDHRFVTVELLGVSNGTAGVRGDGVAAGDTVWVPA